LGRLFREKKHKRKPYEQAELRVEAYHDRRREAGGERGLPEEGRKKRCKGPLRDKIISRSEVPIKRSYAN